MTDARDITQYYEEVALVRRSDVPPRSSYLEYRQYLRHDFFHSCAYCTISEAEAQAVRFTIDHYEPRNARPDLEHDYTNLMWACDECNLRKSDRCPPPAARKDGNRFFRPDYDYYLEHFERDGLRLKERSRVGWYTINALELNRLGLRRIREIREKLKQCDAQVTAGIVALSKLQIDRLPPNQKGMVLRYQKYLRDMHSKIVEDLDDLLRAHARSPLLDPDPEQEERAKDRRRKLADAEALYPGMNWRAPRKPR